MEILRFLVDNTIPGQSRDELTRLISEDRRLSARLRLNAPVVRDLGLDRRAS